MNRVDITKIPEGWKSIAYSLVERIDEHLRVNEHDEAIQKEWKITQIDINRHGKLTITGTHIKNFESEIFEVAKIAEEVCCVCGNSGSIEVTNQNISLPLCLDHLKSANQRC